MTLLRPFILAGMAGTAIGCALLYLGAAFSLWNTNPAEWTAQARSVVAFGGPLCGLYAALARIA